MIDPIQEIVASRMTRQPPIGAALYCPRMCGWQTEVENGLRAIERQDAHMATCGKQAAGDARGSPNAPKR
jgi:hypothetical protein